MTPDATPHDGSADVEAVSAGRRPRIVIVGAGFGGTRALRTLAAAHLNADIVIVDRLNYNGFWPLLYQVAIAGLEPGAIGAPIRSLARRAGHARFVQAEVRGVDFARREALTDGPAIPYDYLILAAGSANDYFGHPELGEHTYGLKDIYDAVRLRDQIIGSCERAVRESDPGRREVALTTIIVGGGPTGAELAGAIADFLDRIVPRDYPSLRRADVRVIVVQGGKTILKQFPATLRAYAARTLRRRGVELILGRHVSGVERGVVTLDNGATLQAATVVWAAGVRAALLTDALDAPRAHKGRVTVTPRLSLKDHPEVFVIGDMAALPGYRHGEDYPMLAPVAIQQGRLAAHNVVAAIQGRPQEDFHYFDKGIMASLGWNDAILASYGVRVTGYLAWLCWLAVHQLYLTGGRTRLLTLATWALNTVRKHESVQIAGLHEGPATARLPAETDQPSASPHVGSAPAARVS